MVTANSVATFCCFNNLKNLNLVPVKLGLRNWNVDLLTYTGQFYRLFHNATFFLWEGNPFWEILVMMAVIAIIFFNFQNPNKDFFNVLKRTNIMRYSLLFSLHLINFKDVIDVPVATAPIFVFVLEHGVTRIFRKKVIY